MRFYGLETFLAVAPDAERNSALAELMFRRIEVDRDKVLLTRTLARQRPAALQAPQFPWRNLELQFDLLAHHKPASMHPYTI